MSRRSATRKMKQAMRRMYAQPVEHNKIVRARRLGFVVAAISYFIASGLAVGAYYAYHFVHSYMNRGH